MRCSEQLGHVTIRNPTLRLAVAELGPLGFAEDHFMPETTPENHLEQDISIHIFTVSSAMVGVCLTVIGLIRVVITLGRADTVADDLLAGDALLFLISCLLYYWALRSRSVRRMHRLELGADGIFYLAMFRTAMICA